MLPAALRVILPPLPVLVPWDKIVPVRIEPPLLVMLISPPLVLMVLSPVEMLNVLISPTADKMIEPPFPAVVVISRTVIFPGDDGPPGDVKPKVGTLGEVTEGKPARKITEGVVVNLVKSGSEVGILPLVSGSVILISRPLILPLASTFSDAPE
jgi:hypothetical protein